MSISTEAEPIAPVYATEIASTPTEKLRARIKELGGMYVLLSQREDPDYACFSEVFTKLGDDFLTDVVPYGDPKDYLCAVIYPRPTDEA